MKKTIFILSALFVVDVACGQVAKWLIPPVYDNIQMAKGEKLIITDSLNNRTLWTQSGERLTTITDNQLFPFKDGYAVTTTIGGNLITGFFDRKGNHKEIPPCHVTYSMPYFSDNYLLVYKDNYYRFVNTKGEISMGEYVDAYPFSNGYASCRTYANFEKLKDPYYLLISKEWKQIGFSYEGKLFEDDDIDFISSVNDMNIAIVVAKHKLYFFNGKDKSLSPIFAKKHESNIKTQAKLDGDISECLKKESDTVSVLRAKCGKSDYIQIQFDKLMIPQSITYADGEETVYDKKQEVEIPQETSLIIVKEGQEYGVNWGKEMEVLPPQFDEIITCFKDRALVRLNGKCGMLKLNKDLKFSITINDGEKIGFKHKKYKTTIRMDMPNIISTENAWVEVDSKSGCEVDLPSGEKKETSFGNNIRYDCVLSIPDSLSDEMYGDFRNEITYPTIVCYDGLKSPVIPYKVMAWHYKYYNVDEIESERIIKDGVLSFTFNINAERNPGDEYYPLKPTIQLDDSLDYDLDKISETRYKCKVINLREGNNNIVVQVLEEGCPPVSFPFEVFYTKPVAKTRNKPEVKESVEITKKTKKAKSTEESPSLKWGI